MYRNEIEKTQLQRTKSVIWPVDPFIYQTNKKEIELSNFLQIANTK